MFSRLGELSLPNLSLFALIGSCLWRSAQEACFCGLNGYVNSQNSRVWALENPLVAVQTGLYCQKVLVWEAPSSSGVIGPYFFTASLPRAPLRLLLPCPVSSRTRARLVLVPARWSDTPLCSGHPRPPRHQDRLPYRQPAYGASLVGPLA